MIKSNKLWEKNFTLVVIGQIISLFGNGILRFALPLYLLNITGSSALFGIVSAVSFLPLIFLMPIGGIIADRLNKRNIMVILDFLTGLLMLFFYLLIDTISLVPLIITTMMFLYAISGIYQPVVQAIVPALLDENILVKGNGVVSSIGGLANLVSPIIGGILIGSFGISPIILVSIICFFLSAILEVLINIPYKKETMTSSIFLTIKEDTIISIDYIFKEKLTIKKLMFVICLLNAIVSALIIISLPVFITNRLFLNDGMYGFAQGILAFGGLCGGILTGIFGTKLHIKNLYKYIILIALSLTPLSIAMFFAGNTMMAYVLILISAFLTMCFATLTSIMIITYIQSQTAQTMVGKIMAFVMMIGMFALPLGQAIYGIVFEYFIGYESFVVLGTIITSLLVSIYAKKILN